MSSKPKAPVTRASARTKNATGTAPPTTRTTRAATGSRLETNTTTNAKKATSRKPLVNRANSPDSGDGRPDYVTTAKPAKLKVQAAILNEADKEPIKAFLRIRPHLGDSGPSEPYLEPVSDTAVRMTDPDMAAHSRLSSVDPSAVYTFSRVFPSETEQSEFFDKTTLPLVKDLLEGQNGLLFAYGATNSGKTYTIQGGGEVGSAGILPRALDVIFNSIEGFHGDGRYRPVRLNGIEPANDLPQSTQRMKSSNSPALADILDDLQEGDIDIDPTCLKLDRNHEYTVWLSYSEVYNEKVYDLFASVDTSDSSSQQSPAGIPHPTSTFLNLPLPSSQSHSLLVTRKALQVKSCPPSDNGLSSAEAGHAGKYVAGLRQIRVKSAAEAKALIKLGQMHRMVFGTLANSQSSRSHALVTIRILKVHRGERNNPGSIQTSRLTLVDLAGSERTKHTQTSGDRLREAGNINKSLMVLGQCMETLRTNQRTVARSLGTTAGRVDTRDVKKGLAIVPFRHSKLTEVLMDYFVGEGKAVMIVNVNPYDTGFDENSHVMRFSALAREVHTAPVVAAARPLPMTKERSRGSDIASHRRKVTIPHAGPGRKASEAHLEVLEEDEEPDEGDENDDDGAIDPLVDALFDEIERLRTQLYEAEMRCALVEAETREEVMVEMEERMRSMEEMFNRRLIRELESHERKMDAKIDMMNQSRQRPAYGNVSSSEDHADEDEEDVDDDMTDTEEHWEDSQTHRSTDLSRSPSPLARRSSKANARGSSFHPAQSAASDTDTDGHVEAMDVDRRHTAASQDDDDESIFPQETQSSDEFEAPQPRRPLRASRGLPPPHKKKQHDFPEAPSPIFEADVKAGRAAPKRKSARGTGERLPSLAQGLEGLSLRDKPRDSAAVVPDRKARQEAAARGGAGVQYVPQEGEVDTVKKKKRLLGKTRVPTDEMAAIILGTTQESSKPVRRSGRH